MGAIAIVVLLSTCDCGMEEVVGPPLTNMITSASHGIQSVELSSHGTRLTPILDAANHLPVPFSFYFYYQIFLEVVSIYRAHPINRLTDLKYRVTVVQDQYGRPLRFWWLAFCSVLR